MAMDKIYTIALDSETDKYLTLCLYSQVKNTASLRKMLMNGELQCCAMKARLIYDPFQVVVAANKAATNEKFSKLITKSVYTEMLYNLSVSKNISQSLMNFGIADSDTDILVGLVHGKDESELKVKYVMGIVDGQLEPMENLSKVRDLARIKKLYKIDDNELKVSGILDSVISRISVKDFITVK